MSRNFPAPRRHAFATALLALSALAAPLLAGAQPTTKKELVARVLQLQQPGIEALGRGMLEQPVTQLMQSADAVLRQRVPADKREALAREIQSDIRRFMDETTPVMREQAMKVAPQTIGAVLEEKMTEDELRQVIALLESPVQRKFQSLQAEMVRAHAEKLVQGTRDVIQPKAQALQQSVEKRLAPYLKPAASPGK